MTPPTPRRSGSEVAHAISEGYCGGNGEKERARRNSLYQEVKDALDKARQDEREACSMFDAIMIPDEIPEDNSRTVKQAWFCAGVEAARVAIRNRQDGG